MPSGRPKADRQLPECREESMNCHDCVRCAARQLARLSADYSSVRVRQFFQVIYSDPACLPMATEFVQAFNDSRSRALPRRTPASVPAFAMAAAVA
jgi:hypothetical protein